jgi:G3E family GTPase
LIEATGVANPMEILDVVTEAVLLIRIEDLARVTVVDAAHYLHLWRRLAAFFVGWPAEVVRAKGSIWHAKRNEIDASISQAGPSIQFGASDYWVLALPEEEKQQTLIEEPVLSWTTSIRCGATG